MKKIMLLGGSAQQVVAIKKAKELGYKTILCDYLDDNPGQHEADVFYLISTTDKEVVLNVAKKEKIDGIIAYASDPAAPTAAYVAEEMGLPTNPYKSVNTLCDKALFRTFLGENGFNAPYSKGYSKKEDVYRDKCDYKLPVIIKPVDSSGSKGVTVLHSWDELGEALEFAFSFSRGNRVIVEEFIEKKHKYLIGGDVFVANGRIILWGLLNCHRDANVNPLVPVGKSYPLLIEKDDEMEVQQTLQKLVDKLNLKNGAINVELVIDKNNRVWPVDVGPRNGGNMIPDLLGHIFDVDIVEMSLKAAMGDSIEAKIIKPDKYYATHNLHSDKDGIYEGIVFSEEIEKYIFKKHLYKNKGDKVEYFDNASKALGIIFMEFAHRESMEILLKDIEKNIDIKLK